MNNLDIFVDESGDFGPYDARCPHYIVTMVSHKSITPLFNPIQEMEYRLSLLGYEEHCIHSSPAIRGEEDYFGIDLGIRRKIISCLLAFIKKSDLKWKCFIVEKQPDGTAETIFSSLENAMNAFILTKLPILSAYSHITVCYDKGQKQISQLISSTFEKSLPSVRIVKVLPVHSRLFQAADLICTMKRLELKVAGNGALSKSESFFFGGTGPFRKNWLSPLLKSEWK